MATVSVLITDDADDGFDDGSSWKVQVDNYGGSDAFTVADTPGAHVDGGVRFQSVAIPQGATINTATITLEVRLSIAGISSIQAFGDDVDDAPAWSNSSRPQSGFTATTGGTANTSAPSSGTYILEIATCVQEIVDRIGWSSNNSMRFSIVPTDTYGGGRFYDLDGGHSFEAVLDVDFTAGGGGTSPKGPFTHPFYGPFRGPIS